MCDWVGEMAAVVVRGALTGPSRHTVCKGNRPHGYDRRRAVVGPVGCRWVSEATKSSSVIAC